MIELAHEHREIEDLVEIDEPVLLVAIGAPRSGRKQSRRKTGVFRAASSPLVRIS